MICNVQNRGVNVVDRRTTRRLTYKEEEGKRGGFITKEVKTFWVVGPLLYSCFELLYLDILYRFHVFVELIALAG